VGDITDQFAIDELKKVDHPDCRKAIAIIERNRMGRKKKEATPDMEAGAEKEQVVIHAATSEDVKMAEKEIKKKAKKLPTIVNTKRYTPREVKVELTDKEINEAGIELAHKQKQYAEVEEEMKGHVSNYKDRLKEIATQMNTLGNKVTLKYEYRKFSCEIWLNFKTKERVYKDRETHKVIDTAGLEADDYQLRLAV
jgi:hypothetical protein